MDFIKLLGSKSYKEWNFFFDLNEKNIFNKKSYDELLYYIRSYKDEISNSNLIDKNIVNMLFMWVTTFSWIEEMHRNLTIRIKWLTSDDDINDYYNELIAEIWLLFT